eukprot:COSAG02_NODE_2902_length_7777_cov_3.802292_6_plen_193_part_00
MRNKSLLQQEPMRSSRARRVGSGRMGPPPRGPMSSAPTAVAREKWRAASRVHFARAPAWLTRVELGGSAKGIVTRTEDCLYAPPKRKTARDASPTTSSATATRTVPTVCTARRAHCHSPLIFQLRINSADATSRSSFYRPGLCLRMHLVVECDEHGTLKSNRNAVILVSSDSPRDLPRLLARNFKILIKIAA